MVMVVPTILWLHKTLKEMSSSSEVHSDGRFTYFSEPDTHVTAGSNPYYNVQPVQQLVYIYIYIYIYIYMCQYHHSTSLSCIHGL